MGSKPAQDAVPAIAELRETLKARRQAFVDWFLALPEERVVDALPEDWAFFGGNYAGMVGALGAHETFHAGQLAAMRRKLDLGPVFG